MQKMPRKNVKVRGPQQGFSIMEAMIGIAIGMILTVGIVSAYVNSNRVQREMAQEAEQIENGRVAIETIAQDVRLAGYFERAYRFSATDAQLQEIVDDPCSIGDTTGGVAARLTNSLGIAVQHLAAPSPTQVPDTSEWGGASANCYGFLVETNLQPGSDIVLIRRASTTPIYSGNEAASSIEFDSIEGEVYVQTGLTSAQVLIGSGEELNNSLGGGEKTRANGGDAATEPSLLVINANKEQVPGPIAKFIQRVYFVAPCSFGTGVNGVCTQTDDRIPTLKRLDLSYDEATGAPAYKLSSLVEGVEGFTMDFGLDLLPSAPSELTGFLGDGEAENGSWTDAPASVADWQNIVSAHIYVIARNTQPQLGLGDVHKQKTYQMAWSAADGEYKSYGPYDDNFKRHSYTQTVRIENVSKRKERPE